MRVERIALHGFRNYEYESVELGADVNVVTGPNAQGKTNLLEAVYLLASGRSFRTRFDRELVGFGYSSAEILAEVFAHEREQTIKLVLTPGQRKRITVNAVSKTASELAGTMTAVLFCPDDLDIVRAGAAARRKLMDNAICQLRPGYAKLLTDYNRILEHKGAILRDRYEKPSLLDTLDDFSDQLCRISAKLIRYRATFCARLAEAAEPVNRDFSGGRDALELEYKTVSTVTDAFASEKQIYYEICDHQEAHRRAELESNMCLTGAHKDDIEISVNSRSARAFASQGQTRTAALSVKLAEREIYLAETGEYPVLLLDDVLSELDEKRQEFVLNRIGGGQTVITCCEDDNISRRTGGRVFAVNGGRIKKCTST